MNTYSINLDRPRQLRLTEYSLNRLQAHYGGRPLPEVIAAARAEPKMKMVRTYLFLLAVDEDPSLTVEVMGTIVDRWLGGGPEIKRMYRLGQLAQRVIKILRSVQESVAEEKENVR